MFALFRKAYRDITKRRVRSLLTLAGIMIGVAGVVAIVSTGQHLARAQAAAYANASQADVSYWVWDAPPSIPRAVQEIEDVSAVELRADLYTRCRWNVNGQPGARDMSLHGIQNFGNMLVDRVFLRAGRLPHEGELVLEQSAFEILPLKFGDTLICRGLAGVPERNFTLVGTVQTPNYPSAALLDYATGYVTLADGAKLLGTAGSNGLMIKLDTLAQAHETADQVGQLLERRGVAHGNLEIRDPENFIGKRELDALLTLLSLFSAVGLLTSGFLVANTLAAMAAEQVGEIGTIKALGGTQLQVLTIYLLSAFLYGIVGTAFGLLLGIITSWRMMLYIGGLLNLTVGFEISPLGVALGVLVGIAVTVLAGAIPAFTATRVSVKAALESYGITPTYGQGRMDRLARRLVALPPLAAMSVRNLARRQGRALVTTLVIAVAVAASLAAQTISASVDTAIDNLFRTYRADAWVYFGELVGDNMRAALQSVPGVERTEVWSLQDAWVGNDNGVARARLWGLPAETQLYSPHLVAGRWYEPGETDTVVISTDLVESLHLGLGDDVRVDNGSNPRRFQVVGITIDNSVFLGSQVAGKVFLAEPIVAQMQRREGWASFFAVGFAQHEPDYVQAKLDEIAQRFKQYQVGSDSAARQVRGAKDQSRILTIALAAMSVLVGMIGALGVLNTITLSVLERRREIGVLRSLGASNTHMIQTFVTEGIAFGVGGWLVGIVLGYPLGLVLTRIMESVLFHIDYVFTAEKVVLSLAFALTLTIAASLAPALAAARVRVREVLRYE